MRAERSDLPVLFDDVWVAAGTLTILRGVTTGITPGAPTIVLGPNGSGKTTFLKLGMGLIKPLRGRVQWGACSSKASLERRAFVFQKPVMLRRSAAENIVYSLKAAGREAKCATVSGLLELVGLSGMGDRPARKLSGGEQQRLALARALAREPEVLFLDEPTASLDPASTKAVEDILVRISASGVKIVMSTHDLWQARRLAGDVIFLAGGRLVEHTPVPKFFEEPASPEAERFLSGGLLA